MSEVAEKPQTAEKRVVILNPQRMGLREGRRQDWVVNAEAGTTVADVLDPQYWSHMAAEMLQYDRVEVLLETGEWMLELVVLGRDRNWAQVHVLHHHQLEKVAADMPAAAKHRVEWKGPQHRFCVIRNSDNEVIQKELQSRVAAGDWLTAYEKATG